MRVSNLQGYDLKLNYVFSRAQVNAALSITPEDVRAPDTLTYSKNLFLPLTTACKYTCAYCVYYDVPGQERLMSPEQVCAELDRGARAGCREALFTFGDTPDTRYTGLYERLKGWGYDSLHHYHLQACEWALERGLLPHSNPGDMQWGQMAELRQVNASMGMMLETTASVAAHAGVHRKTPGQRLQTLEYAGRLKVPFTTGLLIGIGESWQDRALSLLCLKRLHEAYGHLQEVIVQNVVPNRRWRKPAPSQQEMRRMVAMARGVLPPQVAVQVPPNLSPVEALLDCGVGDLGGVSPVTDDFVNPDYQWPAIRRLENMASKHAKTLQQRLAVYPEFINDTWLSPRLRQALAHESFQSFLPAPTAVAVGGPDD